MRFVLILVFLFMILSCDKKLNAPDKNSLSTIPEIDSYIREVMETDKIPGVAVAVLQDSNLIHRNFYGYANIEHQVNVSDSSVFRVYSLTKLMTAVAIFQLIQENRLNLQDSISNYIDGLPESWGAIQIKHLLTHSSGLPEYKDLDSSLSRNELLKQLGDQNLNFQKGERYQYNQTSFWILKLMIEKVTKKDFENVILSRQFPDAGKEAFFASNSLVSYPNRISKYIYNHHLKRYVHSTFAAGNRSLAGNGLNVTLDQLVKWSKQLDNGSFLNEALKLRLLEPFEYRNDRRRFLHGVDSYSVNQHWMYGFSGGAVVDFKKFSTGLTVIILTNGFKYSPRIATMMRHIAGIADGRLKDTKREIREKFRIDFMKSIQQGKFLEVYKEAKKEYPDISFEGTLNHIGYDFILSGDLTAAIEILRINALENPDSFNAFDSLGEAYMLNGEDDLAKKNYRKSLQLNPDNRNAVQMIEKINVNTLEK